MDRVVPYGDRLFPECRGELEPNVPIPGIRMSPGTGLSQSWAPGCPPKAQGCHTGSHATPLPVGRRWPHASTLSPWHSPTGHSTSTAPAWHCLTMAPLCDASNRMQRARKTQGSSQGWEAGGSLGTAGHGGSRDSDSWCFCLKQECPPFKLFFGSCSSESWGSKVAVVHSSRGNQGLLPNTGCEDRFQRRCNSYDLELCASTTLP